MAIDKFLVEASHIMMFARSVGDDNPIYHDEQYAKETNDIIPGARMYMFKTRLTLFSWIGSESHILLTRSLKVATVGFRKTSRGKDGSQMVVQGIKRV